MEQKSIWDRIYENENSKWNLETPLPKIFNGKIVLEVGSGNGKTIKPILYQKPKALYAIDFSEKAVKLVEQEFKDVIVSCQDITKTNFESCMFDVIACNFTLGNMLKNARLGAVKEMHRILARSGIIQFSDFGIGDYRLTGKMIEENTFLLKNNIITHAFSKVDLIETFSDFELINISEKISCAIKKEPNLKRVKIHMIARSLT